MADDVAHSLAKPAEKKKRKLPQRLILCLDGTWNTADGATITNIVRLRDMLQPGDVGGIEQRIYYDEGVGTRDFYDKWTGGGMGFGLDENVRQAYRFLSQFYDPGDEIYIFGFSRGAFAARSIAGYIGASGLLKRESCTPELEQRAWENYRVDSKNRYPSEDIFLKAHCHKGLRISVLGVFDTVGALGVPLTMMNWWNRNRFEFHDTALSSVISVSLQALAIDEKRGPFAPSLWKVPQHASYDHVEQVWFPGVHSDTGGGYGDGGVGALTLKWMLDRVEMLKGTGKAALVLRPGELAALQPDGLGTIHDSRTAAYIYSRYRPMLRVIAQQRPAPSSARRLAALPLHARPLNEYIHVGVLERMKAGVDEAGDDYVPLNVKCALDALLLTPTAQPVSLGFVGKKSHPLDWKADRGDYDELALALPAPYDAAFAALYQRP